MLDAIRESQRSLNRLLPRLENELLSSIPDNQQAWEQLKIRLQRYFPRLFQLYHGLYGSRYDFFYWLEDLLTGIAHAWFERPADLQSLDELREKDLTWFQSNRMLGGVCYVDFFAGNLEGIRSRIPYFQELGLTYLHLMPFFKSPEGENDGGYAVSSYREVNPSLGTMGELSDLSRELRKAGISLVVDLVFNHTSDQHEWAKLARAGDEEHSEFYYIFPDRSIPDLYEKHLREIFPEEHSGSFTWREDMGRWIWTTFHTYQWDLNYSNPAVFNRMAEEMLFLANQGVEVLRLDAVAFIWKRMGSNCENLPEAHQIIQAYNAVARIACPAMIFKSEAIVHPDEVIRYIAPDECQLSYNPLLMALLWNSLATRKVRLLSQALNRRFHIHPQTAWVNYVRVHDDIGWTFSDEDAALLGINGYDHRKFLNEFYSGRFPGSFARGLPFQENPQNGDCRISGTCASLAGLEKAINEEGPWEVELAIRRILLMHGVILTSGGIPLIYLGDEIGTLNDYSFHHDPNIYQDSRWVHRIKTDWAKYSRRKNPDTVEERVFSGLQELIRLRKSHQEFSGGELAVVPTRNDHVLGYSRNNLVIFANFSEHPQNVDIQRLELMNCLGKERLHGISSLPAGGPLELAPYDFFVLG